MQLLKSFPFRGWLPPGLVLNARLSTTPVITSELPRLSEKYKVVPALHRSISSYVLQTVGTSAYPIASTIPQASDSFAIVLNGEIKIPGLIMPLMPWPSTTAVGVYRTPPSMLDDPCMLVTTTFFDGIISLVAGEDMPLIEIILDPGTDVWIRDSLEEAPTRKAFGAVGMAALDRSFKYDEITVPHVGVAANVYSALAQVSVLPISDPLTTVRPDIVLSDESSDEARFAYRTEIDLRITYPMTLVTEEQESANVWNAILGEIVAQQGVEDDVVGKLCAITPLGMSIGVYVSPLTASPIITDKDLARIALSTSLAWFYKPAVTPIGAYTYTGVG